MERHRLGLCQSPENTSTGRLLADAFGFMKATFIAYVSYEQGGDKDLCFLDKVLVLLPGLSTHICLSRDLL